MKKFKRVILILLSVLLILSCLFNVCISIAFIQSLNTQINVNVLKHIVVAFDWKNVKEETIIKLKSDIQSQVGVIDVKYTSATDAYNEYLQYTKINQPDIYSRLLTSTDKKLPTTLEVTVNESHFLQLYNYIDMSTKDIDQYVDIRIGN